MANTNNIEFQKISRSSGDLYRITLETQSDSSVTPKIIQTDSAAVAKKEFNTLKEEYPQATVNGQQNYDPFEGDANAPANTDLPAAFSAAAEDEPPAELPPTPFDDLPEPQFDPYEDFSDAGFGALMIDAVSYIGDILSFYVDYQANESFIDSAI